MIEHGRCREVVVVGAGYIGIEMAEAFIDRGAKVTVVDRRAHPLGPVDPPIAARIVDVLEGYGVTVRSGVDVQGFGDRACTRRPATSRPTSPCSGSG